MSLLFDHLTRARALLTASPLGESVAQAVLPLNEAIEILRSPIALSPADRERLVREVAAVGQLLQGVNEWLSSRGALVSTYDCHAGLRVHAWSGQASGGTLAVEG